MGSGVECYKLLIAQGWFVHIDLLGGTNWLAVDTLQQPPSTDENELKTGERTVIRKGRG